MPLKSIHTQLKLFSSDSNPVGSAVVDLQKKVIQCDGCAERFLSDREVATRYDISRASVWRWLASESKFPAPLKLSAGTSRWRMSELVQFEAKAGNADRKKRRTSKSGTAG